MKNKFELGQIFQTAGILAARRTNENLNAELNAAFAKYITCNWGDTCDGDKTLNDEAIKNNSGRIVAKYKTSCGNVFIITEADRSATTILFADEY